jgi:exodeoxyribonuclease VII small subunit
MDSGGLSLEESMKLYEEGIRNSDKLTSMLAEARDRVLKLVTDKNGKVVLDLFDGVPGFCSAKSGVPQESIP